MVARGYSIVAEWWQLDQIIDQSIPSLRSNRRTAPRGIQLVALQAARLMQVDECLHHYTIGLPEPPRAFRFCSAAPAPHAKPRHGTFFLSAFLDLDFLISELQPSQLPQRPTSAPRAKN
jgi:hypothetical protein